MLVTSGSMVETETMYDLDSMSPERAARIQALIDAPVPMTEERLHRLMEDDTISGDDRFAGFTQVSGSPRPRSYCRPSSAGDRTNPRSTAHTAGRAKAMILSKPTSLPV